jgi:hypothetical protein
MGTGMVLPQVWKSKPIPIPEHTRKRKHTVLPVPESHLTPTMDNRQSNTENGRSRGCIMQETGLNDEHLIIWAPR